jgi:hypothetical protein
MEIAAQTLKEHQQLINLIDELITTLKGLPKDVQWGESSWAQDSEILDFIRIQVLSLQNIKRNTIEGYYRDAYHLIRMVFEGYLILRLVSTCDKYPLRIRLKRAKNDPSLRYTKDRVVQQLKQRFGNDLIKTYMEKRDLLVAVIRGIKVTDDKGNDTGTMIPYYYGAWHDFRPVEYHLKRDTIQDKLPTRRFLTGEWAVMPRRIKKEIAQNFSALYKYFLTIDGILENLRLNSVLNKKTTTRVLVHYNFLSGFSHCTSDSISIISRRRLPQITSSGLDNVYDHYFSELALLYACHLLSMYLQHAIYYLKWRKIKLKNEIKVYRPICKKVESDFGYFWFVFNKPHQYDRYAHANRKCNYKKQLFYRPEDIRLGDVRYYENPLGRLKLLHQSQSELTSRNAFTSPFPRDDALF